MISISLGHLLSCYTHLLHNRLRSLTRSLKRNFELNLAENIKHNPKAFWKYLGSRLKIKDTFHSLMDSDGWLGLNFLYPGCFCIAYSYVYYKQEKWLFYHKITNTISPGTQEKAKPVNMGVRIILTKMLNVEEIPLHSTF